MENISKLKTIIDEFKNLSCDFNPKIRDDFVSEIASNLPNGTRVIDISSGNKPYKNLFLHCEYISHEFDGNKSIFDDFRNEYDGSNKYHDIYSPIDNIPVSDEYFDFIICTEVFEHIPEPIKAMKEFVRICKPNGKILITAPFTSGVHQQPYHFYSGFSPFFYNYLKDIFNLKIINFKSQGNNYLLNSQEIYRALNDSKSIDIIENNSEFKNTINELSLFISKYLLVASFKNENKIKDFDCVEKMLDIEFPFNAFTIGYCVLFCK